MNRDIPRLHRPSSYPFTQRMHVPQPPQPEPNLPPDIPPGTPPDLPDEVDLPPREAPAEIDEPDTPPSEHVSSGSPRWMGLTGSL